jgi:hypothetical protein
MKALLILGITAVGFVLGVAAQQQVTVPPDYRQRVVALKDLPNKLDYLAWGVLTVQGQVTSAQNQTTTLHSATSDRFNAVENRVKTIEDANLGTQIADLKQHLVALRNATCPILKSAKLTEQEKAQVDSVCQ